MDGGPAKVGTAPLLQGSHHLGEIQLLVDLYKQVAGVNEISQPSAGELEDGTALLMVYDSVTC